jgi:hypothetical protein
VDPKFVVQLSGREYPLFAGILAEAHERGLQSIETELIQLPTEENGHVAVVKAVVMMKDASTFHGYGDASPKNVNPRIATALLRMAETRAKGRALRDAINCGQTMLEELPDLEEGEAKAPPPGPDARARNAGVMAANERPLPVASGDNGAKFVCSTPACGKALTKGQHDVSTHRFGRALCPDHQKEAAAQKQEAAA